MIYFVSPTGNDGAEGSIDAPWKSPEIAVNKLSPGDILYFREGEYDLEGAVLCKNSGTRENPIVYSAYYGEKAVLNAENINFYRERETKYPFGSETGAIFVYEAAYIRIRGLYVKNSHGHGIAVRDSNNITVDCCTTENTFSCGISLWDTKSTGTVCRHNKILGCTVTRATTWDMLPDGMRKGHEPPHEAISIAGACEFEVAFNKVFNCDKEGIDVKEVSHHGTVHHNHVYDVARQGLYADAWFGPLTHVDFFENKVHDCQGAGIVVAVEQGHYVSDIRIFGNEVFDNWGSGILFGIFGKDKMRYRIDVFNNFVAHNGYGNPEQQASPNSYFWITGGLCMLSAQIEECRIFQNIFQDNKGFDIGYSSRYLEDGRDIYQSLAAKKTEVYGNIIIPSGKPAPDYPITTHYENSTLYSL